HPARILEHRLDVAVAAFPEYDHIGHALSPAGRMPNRSTARRALSTGMRPERARRTQLTRAERGVRGAGGGSTRRPAAAPPPAAGHRNIAARRCASLPAAGA